MLWPSAPHQVQILVSVCAHCVRRIKKNRVNYTNTPKFIVKLHLEHPIFKKNTMSPK